MPITITITADSVAEFQQHVRDFARSWNQLKDTPQVGPQLIISDSGVKPQAAQPTEPEVKNEVADEQPSAPKRRGRKPNKVEEEEIAPREFVAAAEEVNQSSEPAAVSDPLAPQSSEGTHQEKPVSPSEVKSESTGPTYPTREAAVEALKKVSDHFGKEENGKGILLCREILNRFDARKISELAEEKRAEMIAMCRKVIETGNLD